LNSDAVSSSSAWGPLITVITATRWTNANIRGEGVLLYAARDDLHLERNVTVNHPQAGEHLRLLAVQDAGGSIPEAFSACRAGPGCTPFLA
jgi:hypothetical protein